MDNDVKNDKPSPPFPSMGWKTWVFVVVASALVLEVPAIVCKSIFGFWPALLTPSAIAGHALTIGVAYFLYTIHWSWQAPSREMNGVETGRAAEGNPQGKPWFQARADQCLKPLGARYSGDLAKKFLETWRHNASISLDRAWTCFCWGPMLGIPLCAFFAGLRSMRIEEPLPAYSEISLPLMIGSIEVAVLVWLALVVRANWAHLLEKWLAWAVAQQRGEENQGSEPPGAGGPALKPPAKPLDSPPATAEHPDQAGKAAPPRRESAGPPSGTSLDEY